MQDESLRDRLNRLLSLDLISSSRINYELVADFFMIFARAEFALKRAGFAKAGKKGRIFVKWHRFAKSLGDKVTNPRNPRILEAVRYLQEKAPEREVIKNDKLDWDKLEFTNRDDPVFVISSLTTVRNNLFHGGKEFVGVMAERDRVLLEHSSLVLVYLLTLDKAVKDAFGELSPEGAM